VVAHYCQQFRCHYGSRFQIGLDTFPLRVRERYWRYPDTTEGGK